MDRVVTGVKSYKDAVARIKEHNDPHKTKSIFTYDQKSGTLGEYLWGRGHSSFYKYPELITFFWAEEVKL